MRIAISNIAWLPQEEQEAASLLQRLEIREIEVAPTRFWSDLTAVGAQEIDRYRFFWQQCGIEIVALQALLFGRSDLGIFSSASNRAETLGYLKRVIALGARLGAKILVFGSPKNRIKGALSTREALSIAEEFFGTLGEYAQEHGVCFCIEANPPSYGCDFITTTVEAHALVQQVNSPGFGLHLDLGTLVGEKQRETLPLLPLMVPLARHFHFSLPFLELISADSGAVLAELFSSIRNFTPAGCMSIEMKAASPTHNLVAVERALCFLKGLNLQKL